MLLGNSSFAGIAINWGTDSSLVYREDGTTFLLSGGASTLFQLIRSADGVVGAALPDGSAFGNTILQELMVDASTADDDAQFFAEAYNNPVFTAGFVYMRIFGIGSAIGSTPVGTYYLDSPVIALTDVIFPALPQNLNLGGAPSYTLNQQVVPEPSVLAFLGLGGLALAARRRFIA
jgi:hypothetical protein